MKKAVKEIGSTLLYFLGVLLLTWFVIAFIGQRTVVSGASMEPTLYHNDNLIVDKISYRFSEPKRFDVIVFPFQYGEEVYYIKRIIGMPGETVRIDTEGHIYITKPGETEETLLEENYGKEPISPLHIGLAEEGVVLGEDEYFCMGDNRNNSTDSRKDIVGNIKREDIIGKAWMRIWPFSEIGMVK